MVEREIRELSIVSDDTSGRIIGEDDLAELPNSVQNWLKNTGIIGKPEPKRVWVKQKALMKMKSDQKNWYEAEAEQYVRIDEPAFIWTVKMKMSPLIKLRGRDKFVNGRGGDADSNELFAEYCE